MRVSRPPAPPLPPGEIALGGYVIVERIAVGGMAEVFRAERRTPGSAAETVVIKRMLPALAADPGLRGSMAEEARLLGRVRHPNVVRVLEVGEADGLPYLVLEHVPGVDLYRLTRALRRAGRVLDPSVAAWVAAAIARALDAVHEAVDETGAPLALVHRDVSPSNVLASLEGDVKLADFGIARAARDPAFERGTERAKGKIGYLAPEEVRGEKSDRRADVFSAAVIATELFLGRPLFSGGSELGVLLAIRDGDLAPLDALRERLPAEVHTALRAALAAAPEARTPRAALFAEVLEAHAAPERLARRLLARAVGEAAGTAASAVIGARPSADDTNHEPAERAYRVRTSAGRELSLTYAGVTLAIATRELGPGDVAARVGEPLRPIAALPELARHFPASTLRETDPSAAPPEPPIDLSEMGLPAIIGGIVLRRETGLLYVVRGEARKEVYFADGVPEHVSSNVPSELLGEFLVSRGVLSREELGEALSRMPRWDGRLGETLTGLGMVDPVYLFRQIGEQVREKLVDLFTWRYGTAQFFPGTRPPPSGFSLGLDPYRVLELGLERRLTDGLELGPDVVLEARRPAPFGLDPSRLPATAREVLASLASPRPFGDLARELGDRSLDPLAGHREAAFLLALGAITRR